MTKHEFYACCDKHIVFCGCGCPDEVATLIRDVLIAFKNGNPYDDVKALLPGVYSDSKANYAEWFLIYQLDSYGLLEHGVSIRGSWLTPLGKEFVVALETYEEWLPLMTGRVGFGGKDNTTPVIINDDGSITDIDN